MEEKEIKQAINKQLENVEMNPYLKTKTMNYIAMKSTAQKKRKRLLFTLSGIGIAAMFLVVAIPKQQNQEMPMTLNEVAPAQEISLENPQVTRQIETEDPLSVLMTKLTELNLNYELKVVYTNHEISIYKIKIDDSTNFFINTTQVHSKEKMCEIITEVSSSYPSDDSNSKELQFDLNNYFIYHGSNETLIQILNDITEETNCE